MLVIANAYRRLNMWNANCGASFEWVGRAIHPYLGFLTGWLMIVAYIIGTVSEVEVLGPSVLAVFGHSSASSWAYVGIGAAVCLVMLAIAIVGIKITARTQVGLAVVEYLIVIGFSIAGLVYVLSHHVSRRYATPVPASIVVGLLLIAITAVYLLTSSVQNAFDNVIAVTGLLFSIFYILTALAMIVYYRRRVFSGVWDTIVLGILPLGAAVFLGSVLIKNIIAAPAQQKWSLVGIIVLGVLLMLSARFIQKSPFFRISRESDSGQTARPA